MFSIGERVLCLTDFEGAPIKDREATIIGDNGSTWALAFDTPVGPGYGHTCAQRTKAGYGWNVPKHEVGALDNLSPVERKCRRLWNNSKWVKAHPTMAY